MAGFFDDVEPPHGVETSIPILQDALNMMISKQVDNTYCIESINYF